MYIDTNTFFWLILIKFAIVIAHAQTHSQVREMMSILKIIQAFDIKHDND